MNYYELKQALEGKRIIKVIPNIDFDLCLVLDDGNQLQIFPDDLYANLALQFEYGPTED
jgi:hypothetical protein